jgi:hypothetical protein
MESAHVQLSTKATQDRDTNTYLSKIMVSAVSIGAHWGSPHWTSVTLIWQAGRMSSGTNSRHNCSTREQSALMAAASLTALLLGMNMVH